ncbi:MAG TPA: hypothetical protein VFC58_04715 [Desulfosporosinus sp.]|nr:hypothetical protein [Desulfosporosinus sp.]
MKKRRFGLIIGISIGIVLLGGLLAVHLRPPDPTALIKQGLERLNAASSFRYSLTQHQWVEGKDRVLTQVLGEKDGGNTHILGQLAGSEVEMIKIGDSTYSKDPFSKKWIRFTNTLAAQEVFLAELNPLSSLQMKELGEVALGDQEKVNGEKVWVCHLMPSVQNQMMEVFWKDFQYTLYIRRSDKMLVKATIEAKNKVKSDPMTMTLEFKDIGKKMTIQAPDI